MIGTVRIWTVSFTEDDVIDGDLPSAAYENASITEHAVDDVEHAVRVITAEGLTFGATGNDWAANPDGSQIVNYATGERQEVTAHLIDFDDDDITAIVNTVG